MTLGEHKDNIKKFNKKNLCVREIEHRGILVYTIFFGSWWNQKELYVTHILQQGGGSTMPHFLYNKKDVAQTLKDPLTKNFKQHCDSMLSGIIIQRSAIGRRFLNKRELTFDEFLKENYEYFI